jgi:hypothetical protein
LLSLFSTNHFLICFSWIQCKPVLEASN